MCALVQHFLCPLSSNIISGVLKSFNSEELQREQWAVKNYSNSDTRRVEFCLWARWTTMMSQSVLFSLLKTQFHAHRLCYCGQPYLFLWFIYYVHSGLRLFSMMIRWQLLPQVKFRMCPSPDDSRLPFGDIQSCFAQPRITGVHLWSLPVFYIVILTFFRAIPTRLPSFVSSLPLSFMCILHLVISIRSVD